MAYNDTPSITTIMSIHHYTAVSPSGQEYLCVEDIQVELMESDAHCSLLIGALFDEGSAEITRTVKPLRDSTERVQCSRSKEDTGMHA